MAGTRDAWAVTFREVLRRGLLGARFAGLVLAQTARHQTNEIASGSLSRKVPREDRQRHRGVVRRGGCCLIGRTVVHRTNSQ